MPAKQITLGKSFQKILEEKQKRLLEDRKAKQEALLEKFNLIQRRAKETGRVLSQYEQEIARMERLVPAFQKHYDPLAKQAFEERWDEKTVRGKAREAARKIREEVPSEIEVEDIVQFVKEIQKKGKYESPVPYAMYATLREGKKLEEILKPASEVAVIFRQRADALKAKIRELEGERGALGEKHEAELRLLKGELERIGEGMKGLGPLEYPADARKKRLPRTAQEARLAAFALAHLSSKGNVEARMMGLQDELVSIAALAERHKRAVVEADDYRKSVKKLEDKQLQPLLVFLQKHHALRKEDRRYITKEFLKDALRSLKGKVPDAQLKQHAALMPAAAKYAQFQQNIRALDEIAGRTAVHSERMRELNEELKYMEKVRKLLAAAESVRKG